MLQSVCRIADDKAHEVTESQKSRSVSRDGQTHIFMKMMTRVVVTKTTSALWRVVAQKKPGPAAKERSRPRQHVRRALRKKVGVLTCEYQRLPTLIKSRGQFQVPNRPGGGVMGASQRARSLVDAPTQPAPPPCLVLGFQWLERIALPRSTACERS